MIPDHIGALRRAAVGDAGVVAEMLDAFNREYDTPTARQSPCSLVSQRSR